MLSRRQYLAATASFLVIFLSFPRHESLGAALQKSQVASSQIDERERGISLLEQGDTTGAIKALQKFVKVQKNDIRAWHHLGLALSRIGKTNDARKAHEKAGKIGSQRISELLKGVAGATELCARIEPSASELLYSADSSDKYLELSSKPSRSKISEWGERAEQLRDFANLCVELRHKTIFTTKDVTTKARILSKPSPEYTEEARYRGKTGTVVLILILSADGNVKGIFPIARLPYGLTEKSIAAARRIRFVPARKDGKPVSQLIMVEYNFNIY